MIATMNSHVYASAPMEFFSPIVTMEHTKTFNSSSCIIDCKDDTILKSSTTKSSIRPYVNKTFFSPKNSNNNILVSTTLGGVSKIQYKNSKIKKNDEKLPKSTSASSPELVGPCGLHRLKRRLFLQRASENSITPGSSTSTRTSSTLITDEEIKNMLAQQIFRGRHSV